MLQSLMYKLENSNVHFLCSSLVSPDFSPIGIVSGWFWANLMCVNIKLLHDGNLLSAGFTRLPVWKSSRRCSDGETLLESVETPEMHFILLCCTL